MNDEVGLLPDLLPQSAHTVNQGNVANDVETEQIVSDGLTTSFYRSDGKPSANRKPIAQYTSYVQHRGSIPLSWQQDTTVTAMKPKIERERMITGFGKHS